MICDANIHPVSKIGWRCHPVKSLDCRQKLLDVCHHCVTGCVQHRGNLLPVEAFQMPGTHVHKLIAGSRRSEGEKSLWRQRCVHNLQVVTNIYMHIVNYKIILLENRGNCPFRNLPRAFCFPQQVQLALNDYVVHHITARISTRKLCRLIISKSVHRQAEARKANTPSPCAYWSSDTGQSLQNRSSWCNREGWRGQNRRSPPCRYHTWCQQHFSANTAAIIET